ncbi:hypothetical protein DFH08DRAFT_976842 [Mycena albidolilacea]|uniref:Uncharacterized protein n=1 Tax=Mycena albidolilacea TaxID=1033008 RepID=A0AAD7E928_9AGAR|nr:hypothetical protein DFH08DRAFT_976842 [Mycena albidolilacea]
MSSPPPSPLTPLSESSVTCDPPPHLLPHPKAPATLSPLPKAPATSPPHPKARAPSSSAMSKLEYPKLTHTLITLAGLKMEESTAATWWNENRNKLKKLESWAEFAQEVKDRAGQSWVISDAVLRNHLLFLSHPVLRLHVSGQQSLPFTTMKVDTLIATMSSTWDSMLAEGAIRVPRAPLAPSQLTIPSVPAASSSSLPTPPLSASSSGFIPLTHAEKEALCAAGGCYHCRKMPQSPGWVKHRSDSCPGDAAHRIPSCASPAAIAAVGPVGFSSTYEEWYKAVAVMMPAYNPEEDEWSYGTNESNLSTCNI